jgi:hypothetical protein
MLNCATGKGTTYSSIKELAKQPNCLISMLQEPWSIKIQPSPNHPDFTVFSPSIKNPKCAIYIPISACHQPYNHFQYSNFAIAITIQPIDHPPITIYNLDLSGRPIHAASLLPEHILKLHSIFIENLNVHHEWWYGSEAPNTTQINSITKHSK